MAIVFECGTCGRALAAAEQHAGRQTMCPKCGELTTVPWAENLPATVPETEERAAARERGTRSRKRRTLRLAFVLVCVIVAIAVLLLSRIL